MIEDDNEKTIQGQAIQILATSPQALPTRAVSLAARNLKEILPANFYSSHHCICWFQLYLPD